MDIDLHYLFLYPFPNKISFGFCCPYLVIYLILIFLSLARCCPKNNQGSDNRKILVLILIIIILYSAFFLGTFIYSIYSLHIIYNKSNLGDINKVDADEFLEDLMIEVKGQHGKKIFHIVVIILFPLSIILFISAWIVLKIYFNKVRKRIKKIISQKYPVNDKSATININEGSNNL